MKTNEENKIDEGYKYDDDLENLLPISDNKLTTNEIKNESQAPIININKLADEQDHSIAHNKFNCNNDHYISNSSYNSNKEKNYYICKKTLNVFTLIVF